MTPGTSLSHYSIEAELGRGGMGVVYRAKDTKLDRTVAIKVLPASALSSEDDRARFYREAKSAAALNHPHIAQVYQIDEAVPEGAPSDEVRPFIAMEFIDGRTLDAVVRSGPMALDEAVRIAIQVAQALEMAHENNIVHRDIKAANVMLTNKGDAKVLDFGLAKTAHSTMLTRMGSTLGTVAYMSPEQARGENVDHRTDLWALGILLYELIAGRLPFAGDYEQAVTYSILNEDPHPLTALRTGVPMGLEWIVFKLLAKKADSRYQSAKDLIVDLRAVDVTQISLTRTGMMSSATMPAAVPSNPPKWKLFIAPLMLLAGLGIGWVLFGLMGEPQAELPLRRYTQYLEGLADTRWPAVSPGGRYLALGGRDSLSSQPQLHVLDLQTNRLTTIPNSNFPEWPVFSEDETRLAFISGGKLKMATIGGAAPVEIANASTEMVVWAEDGSVYFMTPALEMSRVLPDGKVEKVEVELPEDGRVRNYFPNVALDGHLLMVTNEIDGRTSAWKLDLASGDLEEILSENAWYIRYMDPGWLLVQTGQGGEILVYPFSRSSLEITGLPIPLRDEVSTWDWFSTQTGFYTSFRNTGTGDLVMMAPDEEGQLFPLLGPMMDYEEFQFSPSGRYIVAEINSYESGQDQILQFDLETGIVRQLTHTTGHFEPSLSPDGSRLVVASNQSSGQNIGIVRMDGVGEIEWITENTFLTGDPDWSPSGDLITFDQGSASTELDIWVHSLTDGQARVVAEDAGSQSYPRFSHDSRFIAYQSDQARVVQIWVVDLLTGAKTKVTSSAGFRPVWGPGDRSIYYSDGVDLYAVDVATDNGFAVAGQPRRVLQVGARFFFDVSDQGRIAIAKEAYKSATSLQLIQNFPATLGGSE